MSLAQDNALASGYRLWSTECDSREGHHHGLHVRDKSRHTAFEASAPPSVPPHYRADEGGAFVCRRTYGNRTHRSARAKFPVAPAPAIHRHTNRYRPAVTASLRSVQRWPAVPAEATCTLPRWHVHPCMSSGNRHITGGVDAIRRVPYTTTPYFQLPGDAARSRTGTLLRVVAMTFCGRAEVNVPRRATPYSALDLAVFPQVRAIGLDTVSANFTIPRRLSLCSCHGV